MSCNGCRVLRKGCPETCSIRPCLQWIQNAQSQANATIFLAKFYGRSGLVNLIGAGPQNLRPGVFRSLLYEACGRIVDPVHGSIGLVCSGNWHLCEAAVDAVLNGAPIKQESSELLASECPPLKSSFDIRHVSKDNKSNDELRKDKSRGQLKRSFSKRKAKVEEMVYEGGCLSVEMVYEGDCLSVETLEASLGGASDLELDLTLGLEPRPRKRSNNINSFGGATSGGRVNDEQGLH